MPSRIAVIGTGFTPQGNATPPGEIAAIARAGITPELVETRLSVFPGTPLERGLAVTGYVEAGLRAQDQGYKGVFINTFGDYGLTELKSALEIPVVGAGEASMALAATLGRRFAIVTIWPKSLNFIYDERIASCGIGARVAGIYNVLDGDEMASRSSSDDPVVAMRLAKSVMIDRIVAAAESAIKNSNADTIVLGCTCMAPIGALIAKRVKAPVIEAMAAGYAATEMLVSLGYRQSKLAFQSPSAQSIALAKGLIDGAATAEPIACEPCAIANAAE